MTIITKDNFNDIIKNNKEVIIDFWAPWCTPCKALGPLIEEVSERYPNIVFGKVNVDEEPELANLFRVEGIPYVAKVVDQKLVDSFVGFNTEDYVEEFFARKTK